MSSTNLNVLDVGCGPYKTPGAVGVDRIQQDGVDIVCDLNSQWPIPDKSFDKIIFKHSINHLNDLEFVLSEAVRVAKPNAEIEITSPHFSSDNAYTDPTVKFFSGYRTMNYFCKNMSSNYRYYSRLNLTMQSRWIYLYKSELKGLRQRAINKLIYPVEWAINLFPRIYEKFFCFIIRANEVKFVLRVD